MSFICGLISSLIAMDLMTQEERAKAAQAAAALASVEPAPAQVQAVHTTSV